MNNIGYKLYRIWPIIRLNLCILFNRVKFRLLGISYGKRMKVCESVMIRGKGEILIGDDFTFLSGGGLNPICRNIKGEMYVVAPDSKIVIGNRVGVSSACIWAKDSIRIGNDVNIGGDCIILDNDAHPLAYKMRRKEFELEVGTKEYQSNINASPIVIEDDVWIGARCMILKGVHIGARSIIAAGSVVSKDIPSDCVAGGSPCKVIRSL